MTMTDFEGVLLSSLRKLPEAQKQTLVDFAEYLCQQYAVEVETIPQQPVTIPRPQQESVVKAIKRLAKTYPMLDSKILFEKTSSLMMRNLIHGEESGILIDEMELFFQQNYEVYISENDVE